MKLNSKTPYRLLYYTEPGVEDLSRTTFYAVSVARGLDHGQVEMLICQVIADKTPPDSASRVAISIYYDLDEYLPPLGAPSLEAKLRDHRIASYVWNSKLPKARDRLLLQRDNRGEAISPPRSYDFDHTGGCLSK
jgi:hypothetical protein